MAIRYWKEKQIFSIDTKNTTYQMKVDSYGFLLHLYYGAKVNGAMDYLLTYADRGFSGNPAEAGADRTYSLDVLPQEYPTWGTGITEMQPCSFKMQIIQKAVSFNMQDIRLKKEI